MTGSPPWPTTSALMGEGPADDPDGDGVVAEITEGQVTALTLFVALSEVPVETPPRDTRVSVAWGGAEVFPVDRAG